VGRVDSLIKRFDAKKDDDLTFIDSRGIAYQRAAGRVRYDNAYAHKVEAYEGSEIARKVNAGRVAMLRRHLPVGASMLDIGSGTGEFLHAARAAGYDAKGYEVIPKMANELEAHQLFAADPHPFDAVSLWDVIEHMEDPSARLKQTRKGALLFVSLPVFGDIRAIRDSKHYRPDEHLYYWTEQGFINWAALYGFRLLETSRHECEAGRDSIGAFAFVKDLPDYHDHLAAYQEMHATRHYGSSATELYLKTCAHVVRMCNPTSILDYGCGRSDLVAHFWMDGKRRIARYDPAIPAFKSMPEGRFDLTFCCDVLEHIPMAHVDRVLHEVKDKSGVVLFTISTKPSRAKLPDGRNAHVTLLSKSEWQRWIADYFRAVQVLPSEYEHELVLLAGLR
jgi:2-polyprenyl-3-methyl-5-hydroxy-6-metoxy-1,4-benzoquinol methylase